MKTFRRESGRGPHVSSHAGRGRAPLPPDRVQASSSRVLRVALTSKSSELYCGYWFVAEFSFSEAFNVALISKSSELYCGYWFVTEFSFSEAFNGRSAGQLVRDCLLGIRN